MHTSVNCNIYLPTLRFRPCTYVAPAVSAENESGSPSIKSLGLYTPLDDEPVDDIFNLQSYFTTSKRST
ncbi:hypothetical protein SARC_17051, partial [Sphaeroforma arctica JP610]